MDWGSIVPGADRAGAVRGLPGVRPHRPFVVPDCNPLPPSDGRASLADLRFLRQRGRVRILMVPSSLRASSDFLQELIQAEA